MTKGPQWALKRLAVANVRQHPDFQMRVYGVDLKHVQRLAGQLKAGDIMPPIEVAGIGKAFYVLDGFHRLQAHIALGRTQIDAMVARMSRSDAEAHAGLSNLTHGKQPTQKDKQAAFDKYVKAGRHIVKEGEERPHEIAGSTKSYRRIEEELRGMYSHVRIRTKLKELGIEEIEAVQYPHGYKARDFGETEEALAIELEEEAIDALWAFESLYHSLEGDTQQDLLATAREIIQALENGKRPERPQPLTPAVPLDI